MSAARPIVFTGPRIQQILDGTKSQTRRILTALPGMGTVTAFGPSRTPGFDWTFRDRRMSWHDVTHAELLALCPMGHAGDHLWVKEAFLPDPSADSDAWDSLPAGYLGWSDRRRASEVPASLRTSENVLYATSWTGQDLRWTSPRFMPRWASRITLEILTVRVQRLQDLSDADALAEGITVESAQASLGETVAAFSQQWEELHGPGSWDANPYLFAVEFRRVTA